MREMTINTLKHDVINDFKELFIEDFKKHINSNYLKDFFYNNEQFIEDYKDQFDELKANNSSEIADYNVPIYYSDLYAVFSSYPGEVDRGYDDYINELGKENGGESISDCIKKGIYYILEREVYGIEIYDLLTDEYIEELKEEFKDQLIDELTEEAQEEYEEITREEIKDFIDNYDYIDDLDNYVLNVKLNQKLEEKNTTTKIVKI